MLEVADARGQPRPAWSEDPPELEPEEEWYLQAFWDLSTERQTGMGLGPIPWSKVVEYGERTGLAPDTIRGMVRLLREVDNVYLRWEADKQAADRKEQERDQQDELD